MNTEDFKSRKVCVAKALQRAGTQNPSKAHSGVSHICTQMQWQAVRCYIDTTGACITFHSLLIRCNSCTFDTNIVFLDGMSRVYGYLVVGLITIRQAKIIILAVNIHVGKDQL